MYLKVASVLELRSSEFPRLTNEDAKRGRTGIKDAKSWNGQNDGDREKKDGVIYPHPPGDDEDHDVDRTGSQRPVDKKQADCKRPGEPRSLRRNLSEPGIDTYRGRPCPGIVGVVVRHLRLDG